MATLRKERAAIRKKNALSLWVKAIGEAVGQGGSI
jgi:hypothetical protein